MKPKNEKLLVEIHELTKQIAQIRQNAGISQRRLGELTGIKQAVIGRLELGQTNPQLGTVIKILNALNYTLDLKPK